MDRSFLASADVIEASRNFVCIRLATYEDQQEAEFLRQIYVSRSGDLENTVFCFLAPDGKQRLSRSGRSPRFAFDSPEAMAEFMEQTAFRFPGKPDSLRAPALPQMKSLRLALNVASCDGLPLVVAFAPDKLDRQQLAEQLSRAALVKSIAGRFGFYQTSSAEELKPIATSSVTPGFYVVAPDAFGLDGQMVDQLPVETSDADLVSRLGKHAQHMTKLVKTHHSHVRSGHAKGIRWETEIPVTDAQAIQAQQRRRGRLSN